jgi:anaerobic selenocysteine-containing dehydrogenase
MLQYPMKRARPKGDADPGWVRITWEEALELTASRLLDNKAHELLPQGMHDADEPSRFV